jgi:thiosulfate reductase cytochrome b subunit
VSDQAPEEPSPAQIEPALAEPASVAPALAEPASVAPALIEPAPDVLPPARIERNRHPLVVRVTHWVAVVAILVMAGSGMRIFDAYPAFHRKGETFCCYPFEGHAIPNWLTFGGWLGGARHWHFAMMWVLVVNGFVYLAYVYLHGEWRDLVPRRGDIRDVIQMVRFYLFIRRQHPLQGKYNALQKGAYFAMPWIGVWIVLSGIAIWKPVELAPLTTLFGGYVWARYWHFMGMVALLGLAAGHVFMVFAVDPYVLPSMITGRYNERFAPERRNGRPFYHLLPRWAPRLAVIPDMAPAVAPSSPDMPPAHE